MTGKEKLLVVNRADLYTVVETFYTLLPSTELGVVSERLVARESIVILYYKLYMYVLLT